MNVYQLIGFLATIQYFTTKSYWAGHCDRIQIVNDLIPSSVIARFYNKPDHGWAFLTGRLATKHMFHSSTNKQILSAEEKRVFGLAYKKK